jgi:CBS domain-containing protein
MTMAQSIREVMTEDVVVMPTTATVNDAGREMRERDIGNVVVVEGDSVVGILTDRDIVVRAVAEDRAPSETRIGVIASRDPETLSPEDTIEDAIRTMRDKAIRRLPVVEQGRPIGIVSIGDLAVARDSDSALADISAAEPDD